MEETKYLYMESRDIHLRFGVIVSDYKTRRHIVATQSITDYPLVFLREWEDDPYEMGDYYFLYDGHGLTMEQATEILDFMEQGNTRRARALLKHNLKTDEAVCENYGPVMLDDMIPDDWYDSWKEMEGIITSTKHIPGYWEADLQESTL